MKLTEFNLLDEIQQAEALLNYGVLIAERMYKEFRILLYQLHQFYVEVYYRQYRKIVDYIVSSNSTDILQPYLDQINIRDFTDDKKEK